MNCFRIEANNFSEDFFEKGYFLVPNSLTLENKQFLKIKELSESSKYKKVSIGDTLEETDIYVSRILEDKAGFTPEVASKNNHIEVSRVLDKSYLLFFLKNILKKNIRARRIQFNLMKKGAFLSRHIDIESNPSYVASVLIYCKGGFSGGELVIYGLNGEKQKVKPKNNQIIILNPEFAHEVLPVLENERLVLALFLSENIGINKRGEAVH